MLILFVELTNINKHMNKYKKWYDNICKRGQTQRDVWTENHHIVPDSFYINRTRKGPNGWLHGNPEDPKNKTQLTGREHALAHWLLIKIYPTGREYHKVLNGFLMMAAINPNQEDKRYRINSRAYAKAKEANAKLQSKKMSGSNNPMYGKPRTQEMNDAVSKANTGRMPPQEQIDNLIAALADRKAKGLKRKGYSDEYKQERSKKYSGEGNPRYGVEVEQSTRNKIGAKIKGRKQTQAEKDARGAANKGSKREKKLCEHCNQLVAVNGYARWHGDHCRRLNLIPA